MEKIFKNKKNDKGGRNKELQTRGLNHKGEGQTIRLIQMAIQLSNFLFSPMWVLCC